MFVSSYRPQYIFSYTAQMQLLPEVIAPTPMGSGPISRSSAEKWRGRNSKARLPRSVLIGCSSAVTAFRCRSTDTRHSLSRPPWCGSASTGRRRQSPSWSCSACTRTATSLYSIQLPSRIKRTIGSSASGRAFQPSRSAFTFRHTRLTVSLLTTPPNTAASARRTRRVLVPAR
jgi:hypothetical protein